MKNEKDLKSLVKEILGKGALMSLGVLDGDEVWVSDVLYVFDDSLCLFWRSEEKTRHSKAIGHHPQAAATITITESTTAKNIGLQVSGIAEKLSGEYKDLMQKDLHKKGQHHAKDQSTLPPGESWYKLTPKKIDIIYEPLWGYHKKSIEL
ncbi:MAG TPA: hypothetical protein VLF68_03275 [Candidatus Saccharimonadales bacterium]|nr:hypothetical protein [Candidatus Saccharimonadales bacterium]